MSIPLHEILDVPYSASEIPDLSHPLRKLDLFIPSDISSAPPLLVFVHGGAWRAGDKSHHRSLAQKLALEFKVAVAMPNYRLTQSDPPRDATNIWKHPGHCRDVLDAINFLYSWPEDKKGHPKLPGVGYNNKELYFIGHSCGAHILATLFFEPPTKLDLPPTPLPVVESTVAVMMSEGIYSIPRLLRKYPEYMSFIEPPFGWMMHGETIDKYYDRSANRYTLPVKAEHIVWWIVHSPKDELVEAHQGDMMWANLVNQSRMKTENRRKDLNSLKEGHFATLDEPRFVEIVREFLG